MSALEAKYFPASPRPKLTTCPGQCLPVCPPKRSPTSTIGQGIPEVGYKDLSVASDFLSKFLDDSRSQHHHLMVSGQQK